MHYLVRHSITKRLDVWKDIPKHRVKYLMSVHDGIPFEKLDKLDRELMTEMGLYNGALGVPSTMDRKHFKNWDIIARAGNMKEILSKAAWIVLNH